MNLIKSVAIFFKEVRLEVKKVNWLTREQLLNYTLLTIGFMVAMGLFFGILDYGFNFLLQKFVLAVQ